MGRCPTILLIIGFCICVNENLVICNGDQSNDLSENAQPPMEDSQELQQLIKISEARELAEEEAFRRLSSAGQTKWTVRVPEAAEAAWIRARRLLDTESDQDIMENDDVSAISEIQNAASLGHPAAKRELGLMYKYGRGVKADFIRGRKLLEDAAGAGDGVALRERALDVGVFAGQPGTASNALPNDISALIYTNMAARAGDIQAQIMMSNRFKHGLGVQRSCRAEVRYLLPAAKSIADMVQLGLGPPLLERRPISKEQAVNGDTSGRRYEDLVGFYRYSAEHGDVSAMFALSLLYLNGAYGVKANPKEAATLLKQASDKGDMGATAQLGFLYVFGRGVSANNDTALELFNTAAVKNHADGVNGRGFAKLYGIGTSVDLVEAEKLFKKAAELGSADAQFNLGAISLAKNAYGMALHHFQQAANSGHLLALYNLAMMHLNGFGTQRNCAIASQFLRAVVERGPWGNLLVEGFSNFQQGDVDTAIRVYSAAADMGMEIGQVNAAELLLAGGKHEAALRMFRMAADNGNVEARLRIAQGHLLGQGTEEDMEAAEELLREAAGGRSPEAMIHLGMMHHFGWGNHDRDFVLARRFYDQAAEISPGTALPSKLLVNLMQSQVWWEQKAPQIDKHVAMFWKVMGIPYQTLPAKEWPMFVVNNWDFMLMGALATCVLFLLEIRGRAIREARRQTNMNTGA